MASKVDYEVVIDPETVKLKTSTLFEGVGYCVSGNVNPSILKLLDDGGAKFRSFAGVGTTHFIAGDGADEMKMDEARDIFEVPVVRPKWALLSAAVDKLLPLHGFGRESNRLFSSVIATVTSTRNERVDLKSIWCSISFYGGEVIHHITRDCTHLITKACKGQKFERAKKLGIKIVTPDWVNKCIEANSLLDEARFHPELLLVPQTTKMVPVRHDDTYTRKIENDSKAQTSLVNSSPVSNVSGPPSVNSSQQNQHTGGIPPSQVSSQNILQNKLMSQTLNQRPMVSLNASPRTPQPQLVSQIQLNQNQLQNLPQNQMHPQIQSQGSQQQMQSPAVSQVQQMQAQSPQVHQLQSPDNQPQLINHAPSMQIQGQNSHQQFHPLQQIIQTSQHQQIVQTQPSHQQMQNMPPHSQQQVQNSQQLLQKQNSSQMMHSQLGQGSHPHQHLQNQSSLQHLSLAHSQVLHNQIPQQALANQGSQQILQNSLPPQQIQNQGSQQIMQNQVPQQIQNQGPSPQQMMQNQGPQQIQNQGPQQMIQNQGPQQIQNQGPPQQLQSQGPQQMMQNQGPQQIQNHGPQQQMQNQGPQQIMQNQGPQQIMQNQGPQQMMQGQGSQQMMQSPSPQQMMQSHSPQQMMQSQSPQQMLQNQSPQQMIQNQSPQQMMQNQNPQQMMQNQSPQQMMQNQTSNQMLHSQGPQQMMQNQGPQQMIQNQNPQQMMQNQGPQHMMLPQQNQGTQQIISNQPNTQLQNQLPKQNQHQFQQQPIQSIQYQNQNLQQMQFQAQSPMKTQSPQQFGQVQQQHNNMMAVPQHQVRLALQSPQLHNQQQIHFQVVQQSPNRPQLMMGQMQTRNQFQPSQQIPGSTQSVSNQQTMFRQQQPQGQIQLFHQIQQQRMQSPTSSQPPQQGGQQLQQTSQLQGQLQQPHINQGQIQGTQIQQGQPHYNVVINQQFPPNSPSIPVHQQQSNQQMQPGQQQPHVVQTVQFQTRPNSQFNQQQQHIEIVRQIQKDPKIQQQFNSMDSQQRALLVQKLAQRNREEHLRREMMLRQQQMTQKNASSPQQVTQIAVNQNQSQGPLPGGQNLIGVQNQGMGIQIGQMPNHAPIQAQPDKQLGQASPQNHQAGGQISASQQVQQPAQVSMGSQQVLLQGHQDPQKPNQPISLPNQVLVQNNQVLMPPNQQKVMNPQSSPGNQQQKFLAPAPVQSRPPHGIISTPQQPQQGAGVVRTQQIFTPQVGQQQQRVNVRHVLVHQGQQPRPQVVLQQQMSSQKMAILHAQQQNQAIQSPGNQWHGTPQRMGSPGATNQFQARVQSPEQQTGSSSPHPWNVRPQSQSPQGPNAGQPNMPFVQVVNSKTKTALANLLSNRLQGNTGPESNAASVSTSLTATTSTTQTMCPPPPPPVTSQSLPQSAPATTQSNILIQRRALANITNGSKPIQVNSFGVSRVAVSQASPTLPTTPPRPQYYGHDPQVKLPTEGFLLGCVFWAAEEMDHKNWELVVIRHGGTIVEEYTPSTVTHVLAKTQKFREFQQVLREGKRIVTLHWLSDIILRRTMVPPYYAIHLPVPFTEDDRPMKDHKICISGYYDESRTRIRTMCTILGASWTNYFTKFNTALVSNKAEGMKYQKAREWKTPVVSVQFLNEMLLGHFTNLQMIHSPKYQHFNLEQPFRFDIALAPHLMGAWKVPVRVSPEMCEKYKTIKRPLEDDNLENIRKRAKLDGVEIDDDERLSPPPETIKKQVKTEGDDFKEQFNDRLPPVVVISGFQRQTTERLKKKIEQLGGRTSKDFKEATHLILKSESVTPKLFIAISRLKYILDCSWVYDSIIENKFVDEKRYISNHSLFEKTYGIKLSEVIEKSGRHSLFKGITFHLTKGIEHFRRLELKEAIESAGGIVEGDTRSMKTMRDTCSRFPKRNVIITCQSDFDEMEEFYQKARRPHMINIYLESFLWTCISTQKVIFRQESQAASKVFKFD